MPREPIELRRTGWRIIYGDFTQWSSATGPWMHAPADNVQVVLQYFRAREERNLSVYVRGMHGGDFFLIPGETEQKRGRLMPDDEFERLFRDAIREPEP